MTLPGARDKSLRIGLSGMELQGRHRGIGRYVTQLCRELDTLLPQARFFVYSPGPAELPVRSSRWTLRIDPSPLGRRLSPILWRKLREGRLCRRDGLDVFWASESLLPRLPRRVRTVATVYDLCFKLTPETLHPRHVWGLRLFLAQDLRRSDAVLTISRGTARRLRRWLGVEAAAVARPAVDESFSPPGGEAVDAVRAAHGLDGPYVLTVAAWEPRKNLEPLVDAFIGMREEGLLPGYALVLVGKMDRGARGLRARIEADGGRHVRTLGHVPDRDLPALYAGAEVFVLPSLYEGFGMPALEARACGARVVASDIPELREAAGPSATYVAPTEAGIRTGILEALDREPPARRPQDLPTWRDGAETLAAALTGEL